MMCGRTPENSFGGRFFSGSGFLGLSSFETDGQPDKVISFYGSYTQEVDNGTYGITMGSTYVADVFAGRLKHIKLPDYWLTNLTAFTEWGSWKIMATVKNVFDSRYFTSQAIFHDALVLPSPGTTVDVTLTYHF